MKHLYYLLRGLAILLAIPIPIVGLVILEHYTFITYAQINLTLLTLFILSIAYIIGRPLR